MLHLVQVHRLDIVFFFVFFELIVESDPWSTASTSRGFGCCISNRQGSHSKPGPHDGIAAKPSKKEHWETADFFILHKSQS